MLKLKQIINPFCLPKKATFIILEPIDKQKAKSLKTKKTIRQKQSKPFLLLIKVLVEVEASLVKP